MTSSDRPTGAEQARDQDAGRSNIVEPLDRSADGADDVEAAEDAVVAALQQAAQAYVRAGWPVFPLVRGGKLPAIRRAHPPGTACRGECGRFGHGFHDATLDPHLVDDWWGDEYRGHNVGIATGYRSGLWVLDVDPRHGGRDTLARLERGQGPLGARLVVATPSGGTHLYLRRPDGPDGAWPCSQGTDLKGLGPGLDVRADGGYVVAPPSVVTDLGAYHGRTS